MKRLHVNISVEDLAAATDFYTAMLGAAPVAADEARVTWSLDGPRIDLTVAVDGRAPGLDRLAIDAESDADLIDIHRRLGAANLVANGATPDDAPDKPASNRAVDPTGLVWESHRVRPAIGLDGRRFQVADTSAPSGVLPFADAAPETDGPRMLNIMFLCTGNSARSIMAESIMNRLGMGRFRAFSSGSNPKGLVNPEAIALLQRMNHKTDGLRSKSWDEFTGPGALKLDFVFTLCDTAAAETCPIWPGQPMSAHWGLPDPVEARGNTAVIALAFADTYRMLDQRIGIFVNLPIPSLDRLSLQRRLDRIGRAAPEAVAA